MRILAVALLGTWIAGACGSSPSATPSVAGPSAAAASPDTPAPRELPGDTADLEPGRYTQTDRLPGVTLAVDEGWSSGPLGDRSIRLQRDVADGEVVVTLAHVDGDTAIAAAGAAQAIPGLTVLATSDSRMSGLTGPNLELENGSAARIDLFPTAPETIALDEGEWMWLSLFDTADGILAIAVTADLAAWDAALLAAEPLLETVAIAG